MSKNTLKHLSLWALRVGAISTMTLAVFFFVTSYTIKIEPNCANAQSCVPVYTNCQLCIKYESQPYTCAPFNGTESAPVPEYDWGGWYSTMRFKVTCS